LLFDATPKLRAWRAALGARPSVQRAVGADYAARLMAFIASRDSALGRRAAAAVPA